MCEFCEENDFLEICRKEIDFGVLDQAILSIDMSYENIYANLISVNGNSLSVELKKPIKFCPFCGRKLSEVE